MKSDKSKIEIIREDENFLDIKYDEQRTEHYFKSTGRQIMFSAKNLVVSQYHNSNAWPAPHNNSTTLTINSFSVISGKAACFSQSGIRLMHDWSPPAHEIDVRFFVPTADQRQHAETWAKKNDVPAPSIAHAELTYYLDEGESGSQDRQIWTINCWLTDEIFNQLRDAIMRKELLSLDFAIVGENIYTDDGWDPDAFTTRWALRSEQHDSGYSRCAMVQLTTEVGRFDMPKSIPTNPADQTQEKSRDEIASEKQNKIQKIELINRAITSVQEIATEVSKLRAVIKWNVVLVAMIAAGLLISHLLPRM